MDCPACREIVARRLHWDGALLRLLRVSRQWYDTVHSRDYPPADSPRGGVPVRVVGSLVEWRVGYLPPRQVINTDGWCRLDCGNVVRGDEALRQIIRSFGRPLEWPPDATTLQIVGAVVPATHGIPVVCEGPGHDLATDLCELARCGVRRIDDRRIDDRRIDDRRLDDPRLNRLNADLGRLRRQV